MRLDMTIDLSKDELILLLTAAKIVVDSSAAHTVITMSPSSAHDLLKLRDKLLLAAKDAR